MSPRSWWKRGNRVEAKLDLALAMLRTLTRTGSTTMATVQELQAKVDSMASEVEQTRDAVGAVEAAEAVQIALIQQLRDELAAGGNVPDDVLQKIDATIQVAQDNKARLAQLAVANTPQA